MEIEKYTKTKIKGKTYNERKEFIRNLAKEYQYDNTNISLSYYELYIITNYFYSKAKRYGLVKEFKENGII